MSDNIPFDIQTDILLRLPVVSLVRFRSVSKQWKSLIDSTKFIMDHTRINRDGSQRHLLVRHKLNAQDPEYTSIIDDDNTFPNQKSSVTLPPPLSFMNDSGLEKINSVNGLLCFKGFNTELNTSMIVLWNPTIRKTVGIPIPSKDVNDVFGFGFCRDSSDPKLVKIKGGNYTISRGGVSYWEVDVFTLSSRVWKTVYKGRRPIDAFLFKKNHVCIDGFIYWAASYNSSNVHDYKDCNVIISFDLKSEEFGRVCLPDTLLHSKIVEVNESLGVLEYSYDSDSEENFCHVWMVDFVTKSFAKMFTLKVPDQSLYCGVFWFRKNGDLIVEVQEEDGIKKSRLVVYEPLSGRINGIGINGKSRKQRVSSYMETLLLLDETSCIIPR